MGRSFKRGGQLERHGEPVAPDVHIFWRHIKKAVLVILTAAMTVSLRPFPAGAAVESEKIFHIEEFAEMPDDTAHISVTPGTPVEDVEELLLSKFTARGYWDTGEEKATP